MRVLVALCLVVPILAGCAGNEPEPTLARPTESEPLPGQGIDRDLLSQDVHGILPQQIEYAASTLDGILLHARIHLPDGDGPWPTILQASPYNTHPTEIERTAFGDSYAGAGLVERYVPKGYAVVIADVRGTGNSEGCMDMMGAKEQQDTHDLVEWVAAQDWSNGRVGMQGVSYVGTTPHEAAIMAPEHLDTVVTIAGVTNQWRNVYQGGVPYAFRHYPLTYEATEGAPPPADVERGPAWLLNAADGACDQEEAAQSMAPGTYEKGVYTPYWHERNLTQGAKDVTASILYSQGFADRAVNPMEAVHWFDAIEAPKKAFFHQGGHQYAPREDYFDTELAWFDHWLKDIENGVMDTPIVEIQTNTDQIRIDDDWPPRGTNTTPLWPAVPDTRTGELATEPPEEHRYAYFADNGRSNLGLTDGGSDFNIYANDLLFTGPRLDAPLYMAGMPVLRLVGGIYTEAADNTYWLFDLVDVAPDGSTTFVAEGWFNAHLKGGIDHIEPLVPGEAYAYTIRFEPREYQFEKGHHVGLVVKGHDSSVRPTDEVWTDNFIVFGDETVLELPTIDQPVLHELPESVTG